MRRPFHEIITAAFFRSGPFRLQKRNVRIKGWGWLRRMQRKMIPKCWHISAESVGENEKLDIIYRGTSVNMRYFCELAYGGGCTVTRFGFAFIYRMLMSCLIKRHGGTIFVNESNRASKGDLCRYNGFVIPEWLGGFVDLSLDLAAHVKSNAAIRSNYKRIEKKRYSYRVTRDPKWFDWFYDRMYRPYVEKRFRRATVIASRAAAKRVFDSGELLFVDDHGRWVAGMIIGYYPDSGYPYLSKLGVLDGDRSHVSQGAISALYYYCIKYCQQKNLGKLAMGGTRPFLEDGVLRYKVRSWNMKIQVHLDRVFILRIIRYGSGVRQFFLKNPFICMQKNEPCAMVFTDCANLQNDALLNRLKKHYHLNGLSKISIAGLPEKIPQRRWLSMASPVHLNSSSKPLSLMPPHIGFCSLSDK